MYMLKYTQTVSCAELLSYVDSYTEAPQHEQ